MHGWEWRSQPRIRSPRLEPRGKGTGGSHGPADADPAHSAGHPGAVAEGGPARDRREHPGAAGQRQRHVGRHQRQRRHARLRVGVRNGVVVSCSCPAGQFGDPCCKHAARYYLDAGLLDPEPEPPAPAAPIVCFRCQRPRPDWLPSPSRFTIFMARAKVRAAAAVAVRVSRRCRMQGRMP